MNENAIYSADVCTKMKTDGCNSQLVVFFSSDVIESYTKSFGEAGTIYLHPVNTPWNHHETAPGQEAAEKRKQSSFEPLLSKCFF